MVGWKYVDGDDGAKRRVKDVRYVYGASKQDALNKLEEIKGAKRSGTLTEPSRMTLGEFLAFWLDNVVRVRRSPRTFQLYEQNLRNHVVPYLGDVRVSDLTGRQLDELYGQLFRAGRIATHTGSTKRARPGLATETVRRIHATLHAALEHATVTMRLAPRNVASDVLPIGAPAREMLCLSAAEAAHFLRTAEASGLREAGGGRLVALWWLLLDTGMRIGEALALRWSDYDRARGAVWVRRTLGPDKGPNGEPIFGPPKTPQSRRSITLSPRCAEILDRHHQLHAKDRARHARAWQTNAALGAAGLVFTTRYGGALKDVNVRWSFKRLVDRAGLPAALRLHDLRHTNATLLLGDGEYPKVVQQRLGHKDIKTTLGRYGHVLKDHEASAPARIGRLLASPSSAPIGDVGGDHFPTYSYENADQAPVKVLREGAANLEIAV